MYLNSNCCCASSVSRMACDPSTHSWRRLLVNMCGTLLNWQHFNCMEFFNWRKTIVFWITTSLRNEWIEEKGFHSVLSEWIWEYEQLSVFPIGIRLSGLFAQFWTQEPVLHWGKWINVFAKGMHVLIINFEPFDSFEPERFGENALFVIDPERLTSHRPGSRRRIVVQTRFPVRIVIIRISHYSYHPVLCT
jgi:hypothetical protein